MVDLLPIRTSRGLVELLGQGERRESCHSRGAAPNGDAGGGAVLAAETGVAKGKHLAATAQEPLAVAGARE